MDYITIKVKNMAGELLFEKDFSSQVLNSVVAADLKLRISQGIIGPMDHYSVGVIPKYGDCPEKKEPEILNKYDRSQGHFEGISLNGEVNENTPVSYFTMCIYFQDKMLLRHIPVAQLTEIAGRLKTTLFNIGVIQKDEEIICDYFIRGKNLRMREREIIHAPSHKKFAIELTVRETKKEDLPKRKISSYEGNWDGRNEDDIPILLKNTTLQEIHRHASLYPEKEIGGLLIGDVYYDNEIDKIFVEINDIIPADMAVGTGGSINFTIEASEQMNRIMNIKFPKKRKIGWYHSHLVKVRDLSSSQITSMFFSTMDVEVHKRFREPWQVALVVDSLGKEKQFYRWKDINNNVIETCKGYCLFSKFNYNEEQQ